jgi:hypothetical protein
MTDIDIPHKDRMRGLAWGLFWGLLAAALALLLVLGALTLQNTNATVNDVRNVQMDHSETLVHIDQLAQQVKAEVAGLKTGNATLSHILVEAGQAVQQLERDQAAICLVTHASC